MDKRDMAEIVNRLNNKSTISSGCIFEMFGVKYVAITDKSTNPCEKCAFEECNCMFNVDIPSCNNDVHFEVIKDIKFGLFDVYDDLIAMVKKIDENGVEIECGQRFSMTSIYKDSCSIKPVLIK